MISRYVAPVCPTAGPLHKLISAPRSSATVPMRRNPFFVGQDAALRQVSHALSVSAAAIRQIERAAATGLGGISKTHCAVHRWSRSRYHECSL